MAKTDPTTTDPTTTDPTTTDPTEPNGEDAANVEKWKGYSKTWEKRAKEKDREIERLKKQVEEAKTPASDPEPNPSVEDDLAALKAELAGMKAEKARAELVAKVAEEKGVPAQLLHGDDEDALKASADAIAAYVSRQVPGYPTDKGGAGAAKALTAEQVSKIKDPVERVRARARNIQINQ